ncbi:uncharacterized protein LOC121261436 [Juglans microcarpa x Juglans regia]|uniref:uncharacterized protein LOC121261436 n=1 Tax=Juglans microcarpa x Juglans regia TaxID=2249226 RepID=UPI001B7F58A9|nr:uncharacterized protein LOC121261436 [Juglans microcarpa x Juglans regia]
MKRATMAAAFSPKPSKRYSVRSISLPARSHPSTLRVEEELNKLKSWETSSTTSSSSSKVETTICLNGLSLLSELYRCIEDLLNLPLTQQALAQNQHQKFVNNSLESCLGYLDVCGNTRDAILLMQASIRELQSALRRRKVGDHLSIESIFTAYSCSRRKMKKKIANSLASNLKPLMDNQFEDSPMLALDDHLAAVVRVLRETSLTTVSIFHSLFVLLSQPVLKPKPSRWKLVSKLVQKGEALRKEQPATNELESTDIALGNLLLQNSSEDMIIKAQKIQSAQIRLDALDVGMEGIEQGLECLFRHLIRTRVLLLNIISH